MTWIISLNKFGLIKLNAFPNNAPKPVKKIKRRRRIIPANQSILFLYLFSHPENSKFLRGNFSKIFAAVRPAIVAQPDPTREVPIIMAGSELPAAARIAIAVAGLKSFRLY